MNGGCGGGGLKGWGDLTERGGLGGKGWNEIKE